MFSASYLFLTDTREENIQVTKTKHEHVADINTHLEGDFVRTQGKVFFSDATSGRDALRCIHFPFLFLLSFSDSFSRTANRSDFSHRQAPPPSQSAPSDEKLTTMPTCAPAGRNPEKMRGSLMVRLWPVCRGILDL